MSKLGRVVEAVEKYNRHVLDEVKRARTDEKFGRQMLDRWSEIKRNIKTGTAPTGLKLPRLALPEIDEPGEITRFLLGDGLPGEFPYLNGAYREMYLEPWQEAPVETGTYEKNGHGENAEPNGSRNGQKTVPKAQVTEEPTRLFSGLMLAEDTIQADIFKEVQAQNETIFPVEASLRFLGDMMEWTTRNMPRWYPVSISGYHIGEAGSTPVQQDAYTLSIGFAYAEMMANRGMSADEFGPRLSFFLDCGLDVEYIALTRVSRRIWAIGMRDVFGAGPKAQLYKVHTQTSGRSLIAAEFRNNLTRTAAELMLAYMNGTNSCQSISAAEPLTTPSEEWIRLSAHSQGILLEESGIFKHTMNMLSGSPGMKAVERAVEAAILEEFREIERLGGLLAAVEERYQRSQIQNAAHKYEQQIYDGTRPIIALNKYRNGSDEDTPEVKLARTPRKKQQLQVDRLIKFKKKNAEKSRRALDKLATVVESRKNCFPELLDAVEVCSLGQITGRLQEVVGRFRPMV